MVDPFGGIGSGGIFACPMGLKWVGVELEQKFVDLARQNFARHIPGWRTMNYPLPEIIQADSRHLSDIIGGADCVTTSPPFVDSLNNKTDGKDNASLGLNADGSKRGGNIVTGDYGISPGQIGAMKAGSVDAVCTSPPYAEANTGGGIAINGYTGKHLHKQGKNQPDKVGPRCGYMKDVHGDSPSNIGNLRAGDVSAVVTSPPWENQEPSHAQGTGFQPAHDGNRKFVDSEYGTSPGQLGQTSGSTYWQAVAEVYNECHKILKPNGVLVCVVKAYVKNGKRVPLPMQTLKLLIHLGFTPLERIKAMLVEETVTPGLFGEIRKTKERKSFFRRLAEKKGSPRIDFEEVLVCQK